MAKTLSTLQKSRLAAFHAQGHRCYYCGSRMWLSDPAELGRNASGGAAALLRCTAEHLVAKSEGGANGRANIVAACYWCNSRRHAGRGPARAPAEHRAHVRRRMASGRWLPMRIGGS